MSPALHCPDTFARSDREPVLLVHGITLTGDENFAWSYVPALTQAGYDVCTVDLPERAMVDIQASSEYVVHAIRTMAQRSGRKVDVAGFSQGGLVARWAVKWWPDVRAQVDDLVTLLSGNHGGFSPADGSCADMSCPPSVWQMRIGSAFLGALNADEETPGDISYTSVYSLTDTLSYPLPSLSALDGGTNVAVQDVCPGRPVDHVPGGFFDAAVYQMTLDAFSRDGTLDIARIDRSVCSRLALPGVDPADGLVRSYSAEFNGGQMIFGFTYPSVDKEPSLAPYAAS